MDYKDLAQISGKDDDELSDSGSGYSEEEAGNYLLEEPEESSESEPEVDCDNWDNDCKIIPKNTSSLIGYHLMPTCSTDPDQRPNKKLKIAPEIHSELTTSDFESNFKKLWLENSEMKSTNFEIITNPFKLCVVNNFIENSKILDELRQEFYELDWNFRNMDLYEFFQSKDLKYLTGHPQIECFHKFLEQDVMKWVAKITGYELTHISATCSLYSNTDYLLVHDDQREDRMVAFVLYLTGPEGWSEEKGGALQMLDKDDKGQPLKVVRDIFPRNNQLVFFPVTNQSYHQVAEVTTLNDCRLSINGWFHTKSPPSFPAPQLAPFNSGLYSRNVLKSKNIDIDLESWINEDYLDPEAINQIQQYIEENSEISLCRFFKKESFNAVLQTLKSDELKWVKIGPPNRYSYEVLSTENLPHSLDRFLSLFQSVEMFALLRQYTELNLLTTDASMKFEMQRWTPGSYSLLTDYNWHEKNELDLTIYFGCTRKVDVIGARTQYVTIEDEIQNALITIDPAENNLNIIYRDSARFTKYFGKQSKCKMFYMLICSYAE